MSRSEDVYRANVRAHRGGGARLRHVLFWRGQLHHSRRWTWRGLPRGCGWLWIHCGAAPDIAGGGLDRGARTIARWAELPYVRCKLSGWPAIGAPGTASVETLAPYVDQVDGSSDRAICLAAGDCPW